MRDEDLIIKLGWLNVQQIIWKSIYNSGPKYISDLFTPVSSIHSHNTRGAAHKMHPQEVTYPMD